MGLIHVYTGDGKGKTTAAMGLAVRAAGRGMRVFIVQFFKGRDTGELHSMEGMPNITVCRLDKDSGFYKYMDDKTREAVRARHDELLKKAVDAAQSGDCELLILDEAISAYCHDMLEREVLDELIANKPDALELVLTGRNAPEHFVNVADYVTEMLMVKHPYENNVKAREGIEF